MTISGRGLTWAARVTHARSSCWGLRPVNGQLEQGSQPNVVTWMQRTLPALRLLAALARQKICVMRRGAITFNLARATLIVGARVLVLLVVALLALTTGSGVAARQTKIVTTPDRVPPALVKLSERSAVHLLARQKGSAAGWNGLCTASKISATELISAKHCFEVYSFPPVPSGSYAENVIGIEPFEYEVADPAESSRPLLAVTGISVDDDNDVALITVSPSAPTVSAATRRVWAQVPVLNLPLADSPPAANMPVVVTSFPGVSGGFRKITWTGHFANRRSDGIATPNPGAPDEDNVVYGKGGADACKPGASGSRLIFANGPSGGRWDISLA